MRWLRRLRRRDRPRTEASHALAMVMLADMVPVDTRQVFEHLTRTWPDVPSIADIDGSAAATAARIPGGAVGLAQMPIPIPPGDLAGPTAVAWHWPEAAEMVAGHRSHVVVFVKSAELDAVDTHLLLTKLAASVLAVSAGIGVYVGGAMLVRSAEHYAEDACSATREQLPLLSLVGFNPVNTDGGFSAYTTGLTEFGLKELEVVRCSLPVPDLLDLLASAAEYELSTGRTLGDGDTFGRSEFDRTPVRYCRSEFIPDATVARLEIT